MARLHVVVSSYCEFGHIIPLLQLAKKISTYHDVTFTVSAARVLELTRRELIDKSDRVQVYGITDGIKGDLRDADFEQGGLERRNECILPAFAAFLRGIPTRREPHLSLGILKPVDVVLSDFFLGRELGICHEREIPFYILNTGTAWLAQFILALNDDVPTLPDGEADIFTRLPEPGAPCPPVAEGWKAVFQPMKKALHLAHGLVVNSFREIEQEALQHIVRDPQMAGVKIYCVGPLMPEPRATNAVKELVLQQRVQAWLDRQSVNTVVYVAFGSIATPTPEQLREIGQALLGLNRPFIWALRESFHSHLPEEITDKISNQFEDTDSPFLVIDWTPQQMILKHDSLAVFISHCGWNSVSEAFSSGKPIVGWPMFSDQLENAEWTANLGAGLVIPNTGLNCPRIVPADEIQELVEKVGGWRTGETSSYTLTAQVWQAKLNATWTETGSSYTEFMDLLKFGQ